MKSEPEVLDKDLSRIRLASSNFTYFLEIIKESNPHINDTLLKKAYDFAKHAHKEVKRASGEPYFNHPVEVCLILNEQNIGDTATLCSALLHDVIEDTDYTYEDIKHEFGEEIANIVHGLTKINKDRFREGARIDFNAYKSENMRKIILATAKDIRVLFIKIADRLNNMRTLDIFRDDKKQRIAKQTLKVYSPLAEKLGLYRMKSELEDLCLLTLKPEIYTYLAKNIQLTRKQRDQKTKEIMLDIDNILSEKKIHAKIKGRAKHYYSIYKKMVKENKSLETIYDIYGIRIIVPKVEDCYEVLHIIQERWETQIDKRTGELRLKDYIKNPKSNGYKSIHVNFKFEGSIVEAQIRTHEMDYLAESGVAKHWKYKQNARDKKLDRKIDWLRQLVSWIRDPQHRDLAEKIKFDVFNKEIICITPKGDLIIVKEGATPLDFAYTIHSKVGDHYDRAIVNNEKALIDQRLHSGDIVEIITSQKPTVAKHWLNIVKTNQAKSKIRQSLGMTHQIKPLKNISQELNEFNLESRIEVIGKKAPIKISKCCNPKWGDDITGYYTKDKKITIHKKDCPNRFSLNQKSEVKVHWVKNKKTETRVNILSQDTPGVLTNILDIMIDHKCEIISVKSSEKKKNIAISIQLKKNKLERIDSAIKEIQSLPEVLEIRFDS